MWSILCEYEYLEVLCVWKSLFVKINKQQNFTLAAIDRTHSTRPSGNSINYIIITIIIVWIEMHVFEPMLIGWNGLSNANTRTHSKHHDIHHSSAKQFHKLKRIHFWIVVVVVVVVMTRNHNYCHFHYRFESLCNLFRGHSLTMTHFSEGFVNLPRTFFHTRR